MIRRRLFAILAALTLVTIGQSAQAGYNGSFGFGAAGNIVNGNDLTATQYTFSTNFQNTVQASGGSGVFSGVTYGVIYATDTLDLSNLSGFTMTNDTFGMFQAGAGSYVEQQSSSTLTVYLLGTYTGSPTGGNPTAASVLITFTQVGGAGNSVSSSGTLAVPPAPASVPEPASIAMLGLGLVGGVGGYSLRRRRMASVS